MVSIHKRIMFSVSNSFLGEAGFQQKVWTLSTLYQFLNLFCLTQAGKLLNIDTSNCPMCRKSLRKCEAMLFHYVPGKIISQKPESSKRGGNLGKKLKPAPGFVAVLISFGKSGGFPSHLRLQLPAWLRATSVFDLRIGHPHPTNLLHSTSSLAQIQHVHVDSYFLAASCRE